MNLGQPKQKSTVISYGEIRPLTDKANKVTTAHMLSDAHRYHDLKSIETMQQELIREKVLLGAFMTKFLDKFERKMNADKVDTPIWDLYHAKMREYNRLDGLIKCAQYYLDHP